MLVLKVMDAARRAGNWVIAIGVIAFLAAGYMSVWRTFDEVETAANVTAELRLSDSGIARLERSSALKFSKGYARWVHLRGGSEIMIPRLPDGGRFTVETEEARIETTGARFHVDSREGRTIVRVFAGEVEARVYDDEGQLSRPTVLTAGGEARVVARTIVGVR